MTLIDQILASFSTVGSVIAVMVLLAALEVAVPARARGPWHRAHVGPNLLLTGITFVTNAVLNAFLVLALVAVEASGYRPLAVLGPIAGAVLVVLALDLAWYVAHRTMHRSAWLWRIHAVHHSDPAVDVTTTIRQHPAEGLVRYAYMGTVALAIGAGPAAFAVYRVWSVLQGLWTHANLRLPARIDAIVSLAFVTPGVHRLHHSRDVRQSSSNYATITTWFDRLFGTFTAPRADVAVEFGIDGYDTSARQRGLALLRAPWRSSLGIVISAISLALVACAPAVHTEVPPTIDVATPRSYAWWTDAPGLIALGRAQPELRTAAREHRLRSAIAAALEREGILRTRQDEADVLVAFTVDTVTRVRLEGGSGSGDLAFSGPGEEHTRWTLHVHMLDRSGSARWHAWTSAWLTGTVLSDRDIDDSVARVFAAYPSPCAAGAPARAQRGIRCARVPDGGPRTSLADHGRHRVTLARDRAQPPTTVAALLPHDGRTRRGRRPVSGHDRQGARAQRPTARGRPDGMVAADRHAVLSRSPAAAFGATTRDAARRSAPRRRAAVARGALVAARRRPLRGDRRVAAAHAPTTRGARARRRV